MKLTALMFPGLLALCICSTRNTNGPTNLGAIKQILAMERKSHFEKNVELLLSMGLDPLLSVDDGSASLVAEEKSRKAFTDYFNSVEFIKWDDTQDPIFNFSRDSTIAVVTVQKIVILKERATEKLDTTHYAWTAVYRKTGDQWKMIVMTSTDR
jgi:hypothetical protein